jgi:hypothetical protein
MQIMNNLANNDLAQPQNTQPNAQGGEIVYGVRADAGRVVLLSLNLQTNQVRDLSDRTAGLRLQPKERLTNFLSFAADTFEIISIAPTSDGKNLSNRLSAIAQAPNLQSQLIAELGAKSTIESLVPIRGNKLLSLVSLNSGTPPFVLAISERRTNRFTLIPGFDRPPNWRLGNLTYSPKGEIYVTTFSSDGYARLGQIDLAQQRLVSLQQLRFNGRPLFNALRSMAMSPSGRLYAIGDLQYQGRNSLFAVDIRSGTMNLVRAFEVDKIAFTRP